MLASADALGAKVPVRRARTPRTSRCCRRGCSTCCADEHGLGPRERLLLQVAALLHDIGLFVSLRAHHKHSQYLLAASEIFGLSRDEMAIVANIARYHRRGLPQKRTLPYMRARSRRPRARQQAGGDPAGGQRARRRAPAEGARHPPARAGRDAWMLELDGAGDLTMERLAATARADMFAEMFGQAGASSGERAQAMTSALPGEPEHFFNRELSWLAFNERVLEEAADPSKPLLERVQVRGDRRVEPRRVLHGARRRPEERHVTKATRGPTRRADARRSSSRPISATRATRCSATLYTLVWRRPAAGARRAAGIRIVRLADLERRSSAPPCRRSSARVLPVLTPLAIDMSRPFPLLSSLSLNLAFWLSPADGDGPAPARRRAGAAGLPRLVASPERRRHVRAARRRHPRRAPRCFPGRPSRVGGHPALARRRARARRRGRQT